MRTVHVRMTITSFVDQQCTHKHSWMSLQCEALMLHIQFWFSKQFHQENLRTKNAFVAKTQTLELN